MQACYIISLTPPLRTYWWTHRPTNYFLQQATGISTTYNMQKNFIDLHEVHQGPLEVVRAWKRLGVIFTLEPDQCTFPYLTIAWFLLSNGQSNHPFIFPMTVDLNRVYDDHQCSPFCRQDNVTHLAHSSWTSPGRLRSISSAN